MSGGTTGHQSSRRRIYSTLKRTDDTDSQSTNTSVPPSLPLHSFINNILINISVIYELAFLIIPYILTPWTFIQIYFPTFTNMSQKFNPTSSIPSLANKVILVTGGNAGLGKETILQLARHAPSKIYLGARSADKANTAINSINNQCTEKVDIEHLPLDLNSLASVRAAAEIVKTKSTRLDILILNAGIMATPAARTTEGFDSQFGVNHIGHFYLFQQLLPLLQATSQQGNDVRIVSLTSEAYNLFRSPFESMLNTEKLAAQSAWSRYGASKAANILFASEVAKKYPQFTAASVHPGIIMTDLHTPGQKSFSFVGWFMKLASPLISQDVPHGAYNSLWAATSKEVKSGKYYTPVGKQGNNKWVNATGGEGERLWAFSEEEIKKAGF